MSNGYQSDEDLLAESVDAERSRSFEGKDRGEWIASGDMDIEDAWDNVEEETEEDKQRKEWRKNWKGSDEEKRYNYVYLGVKMTGYVPSEEDEINRQKEADSYKNAVEVYY
jgi:hypothetical protein